MTPNQIGEMTQDQIWILGTDEKNLERQRYVTGTFAELSARGLAPEGEGISLEELLTGKKKRKPNKAERRRILQDQLRAAGKL